MNSTPRLKSLIRSLQRHIDEPSKGLPEPVFRFISGITPLVNVDLLIQDENRKTLLTWRDDSIYGAGWHVPGGILRFKETFENRIREVARNELGAEVSTDGMPVAINQAIDPSRDIRGHHISLLFKCTLLSGPAEDLQCRCDLPKANEWMWHNKSPKNLLKIQRVYSRFIDKHH